MRGAGRVKIWCCRENTSNHSNRPQWHCDETHAITAMSASRPKPDAITMYCTSSMSAAELGSSSGCTSDATASLASGLDTTYAEPGGQ